MLSTKSVYAPPIPATQFSTSPTPNHFVIQIVKSNGKIDYVQIDPRDSSRSWKFAYLDQYSTIQGLLDRLENGNPKYSLSNSKLVHFFPPLASSSSASVRPTTYSLDTKLVSIPQDCAFVVERNLTNELDSSSSASSSASPTHRFKALNRETCFPTFIKVPNVRAVWGAKLFWLAGLITDDDYKKCENLPAIEVGCNEQQEVEMEIYCRNLEQSNILSGCLANELNTKIDAVDISNNPRKTDYGHYYAKVIVSGIDKIKKINTDICHEPLSDINDIANAEEEPRMKVFTHAVRSWVIEKIQSSVAKAVAAVTYCDGLRPPKEPVKLEVVQDNLLVRFTHDHQIIFHCKNEDQVRQVKYMCRNEGYAEADLSIAPSSNYWANGTQYTASLHLNCKTLKGVHQFVKEPCGLPEGYCVLLTSEMSLHTKAFEIPEDIDDHDYKELIKQALNFRVGSISESNHKPTNEPASTSTESTSASTASSSAASTSASATFTSTAPTSAAAAITNGASTDASTSATTSEPSSSSIKPTNTPIVTINFKPNELDIVYSRTEAVTTPKEEAALISGLNILQEEGNVYFSATYQQQGRDCLITIENTDQSLKMFFKRVCGLDEAKANDAVLRATSFFDPSRVNNLKATTKSEKIANAVQIQTGLKEKPKVTHDGKNILFQCANDEDARKLAYACMNQEFKVKLQANLVGIPHLLKDEMNAVFQLSLSEQVDFYVENNRTIPVEVIIKALESIGARLTRESPKADFENAKSEGKKLLEKVKTNSLATNEQKEQFGKEYEPRSSASDKSKNELNTLEYFKVETGKWRAFSDLVSAAVSSAKDAIIFDEDAGAHVLIRKNYTLTSANKTPTSNSASSTSTIVASKGASTVSTGTSSTLTSTSATATSTGQISAASTSATAPSVSTNNASTSASTGSTGASTASTSTAATSTSTGKTSTASTSATTPSVSTNKASASTSGTSTSTASTISAAPTSVSAASTSAIIPSTGTSGAPTSTSTTSTSTRAKSMDTGSKVVSKAQGLLAKLTGERSHLPTNFKVNAEALYDLDNEG